MVFLTWKNFLKKVILKQTSRQQKTCKMTLAECKELNISRQPLDVEKGFPCQSCWQFNTSLIINFLWRRTRLVHFMKLSMRLQLTVTEKALTLKAPITTKSRLPSPLLKCLTSLNDKQCGPRSDCSYRSSLIWTHPVCSILRFISYVNLGKYLLQTTSADVIFQMHFSWGFKD